MTIKEIEEKRVNLFQEIVGLEENLKVAERNEKAQIEQKIEQVKRERRELAKIIRELI